MPNRILKESIRTSRSVNQMTDFQFRIWAYLITYVDDYGRGSADPELLKSFLFPRRKRISEADIAKALADLAGMGCILLYEIDGESYLCFPKWSDHQRIRQSVSKFPAPEEEDVSQTSTASGGDLRQLAATCGELRRLAANGGEWRPESNPSENPIQNPESGIQNPSEREHTRAKSQSFQKPTVEEVAAYCRQRGDGIDPEHFCDYYEANGWKVGREPMKDWKAAVRNWERRSREEAGRFFSGKGNGGSGAKPETSMDLEAYEQGVLRHVPVYAKDGKGEKSC